MSTTGKRKPEGDDGNIPHAESFSKNPGTFATEFPFFYFFDSFSKNPGTFLGSTN